MMAAAAPAPAAPSPPPPPQHVDQSASWQRIEIEPGLELHIRSDYAPPATSGKIKSLLEKAIHRITQITRMRR